MTLITATSADAEAVAQLHLASWRATYRGIYTDAYLDGPEALDNRRTHWARRLAPDFPQRRGIFLARGDDGALAGFACVLPDEEPDAGVLLDNLHVSPVHQGRGLGRRLLDEARRWAARQAPDHPLVLYVYEANTRAVGFYDHAGGVVVARRVSRSPVAQGHVELRYAWPPLGGPARG